MPYIIIEIKKYYSGKYIIFFIMILCLLFNNVYFLNLYWNVYPHSSAGWAFLPVYLGLWFILFISVFIKKPNRDKESIIDK